MNSFKLLHQEYDFFAGLEPHPYPSFVANGIFGAQPQHPIVNQCIKNIQRLAPDNLDIIIATGPGIISRSIAEKAFTTNTKLIILPSVYLFDNEDLFRINALPLHMQAFSEHSKPISSWQGENNPL